MKIGFVSPEAGGSHSYMSCGAGTFTAPGNEEYSVPQLKALPKEIERGINRK